MPRNILRIAIAIALAAMLHASTAAQVDNPDTASTAGTADQNETRRHPSLQPPPRLAEIDWQAVRAELERKRKEGKELVLALAPKEHLRQVRLPVLVPDLPEMRSAGRVFPSKDFYSASVTLPNAVIEIYGTRSAKPVPAELAEALVKRAKPDVDGLFVQENETGIEVSFQRFNASYNIAVTCDKPLEDERCRAADFVRDLAQKMSIAGGESSDGEE